AAYQAAADVPELRELDFELALEAARPLGEDVEDQAVAIEHAPARELLEIALLAGRKRVIHQDHVRSAGLGRSLQLLRLATAHEETRIGPLTPARHRGDRLRAGRDRKLIELLQILRIDLGAETDAHQERALTGTRALEHSAPPCGASLRGRLRWGSALFRRQAHVARRHDGGDGVLVDHLTDAVLQQHHELVERIYLALQLDAVDEVDGYGHPFFAQRVQERILERLAFGHRVLLVFTASNCSREIEIASELPWENPSKLCALWARDRRPRS